MANGNGQEQQPPAETQALTVIPASALDILTRAEIESQAGMARKFRRSHQRFKHEALAIVTLDQETAAACSYAIPRDGKIISGPSIRLAEVVLACWGNLRAGSRLIAEDPESVTAQGFCHDLETNTAITVEVRRPIVNRHGSRYSIDMINVTANAAMAIALRNATFRVVPQVLVEQIRQAAIKTAAGTETTLSDRRASALTYFTERGVSAERVIARLAEFTDKPKAGVEDIDVHDMAILHGFATSLRDGVATIAELFPVESDEPKSKAGQLADELKGKRGKKESDK